MASVERVAPQSSQVTVTEPAVVQVASTVLVEVFWWPVAGMASVEMVSPQSSQVTVTEPAVVQVASTVLVEVLLCWQVVSA